MAKPKAKSLVSLYIAVVCAATLLIVGGLAMWAHVFTGTMVQTELAAQKIYFPEAGTAAFDPATYPDLQQYAGKLVDTPAEAKAYANGYIARHLAAVADGKVYAEVSAAALKDPTNQTLQQQKQTLFQGETLRGILLTSGYGFGTVGVIAGFVAYGALALGLVCAVGVAILRWRTVK